MRAEGSTWKAMSPMGGDLCGWRFVTVLEGTHAGEVVAVGDGVAALGQRRAASVVSGSETPLSAASACARRTSLRISPAVKPLSKRSDMIQVGKWTSLRKDLPEAALRTRSTASGLTPAAAASFSPSPS